MNAQVSNPQSSQYAKDAALPVPEPKEQGAARGVIDAKHEAYRRYTLIGKEDQQFSQTAGELLEGSKLLHNRDLVVANLTAVFRKIRDWCARQPEPLATAIMTVRPGRITLFFVTKAQRYDLALDEAMTDLEVDLGGSAGVGTVESFQIPERSTEQFVGADSVLLWVRGQ